MFRCVLFAACVAAVGSKDLISITNGNAKLIITKDNNDLTLNLIYAQDDSIKLSALLGVDLDSAEIGQCLGLDNCLTIDTDIRLHVTKDITNGFEITWSSKNISKVFTDCYKLSGAHWYGGPEWKYQAWPIEKLNISDFSYVIKNDTQIAVGEPYWLNSLGGYIFVNHKVPLFIDQNGMKSNFVCFRAKAVYPYSPDRKQLNLVYTIVASENSKTAHLHAVDNFLGKPTGRPNSKMIERPIWSTWARYFRKINDTTVKAFAQEIIDNGYEDGQLEIDDKWEYCYGSLTFDTNKFANITTTIRDLHDKNFRVTFWTHPFVNTDCNYTDIGRKNDFFVNSKEGNDTTLWWNTDATKGETAEHVDFTNAEAREWFIDRLRALKQEHGMDSFKFDAGETDWLPHNPVMGGDPEERPNIMTENYVRAVSSLGDMIEVRSAWRTQDLPIFVRMIDKDSRWDVNNGLYTLVTTLLQMNMNGYSMVLPDMVGGNGYDGKPDDELFIRWLQANTFMPAIQFSFVPWDFNSTIQEIAKTYVELHTRYSDTILGAMDKSIGDGVPVNAPIWWIDPENPDALACDTEYILGETILVAPILEKGSTKRDIVLPKGRWTDGHSGEEYEGNQTLKDYPAPLEILPYFILNGATSLISSIAVIAISLVLLIILSIAT